MRRLLGLAAALCLGGCGVAEQGGLPAGMLVVPGVPGFQEQSRRDDCAGVALASLLGHGGMTVAPAAVDAAVYDPRLGGALLADLERFAAAAGARPRSGRGNLAELRDLLAAGVPVLVPIDLGSGFWRRPHYVVLFGFSAHDFLLHQRAQEVIVMPAAEFEERWSAMGRLRLYLEP